RPSFREGADVRWSVTIRADNPCHSSGTRSIELTIVRSLFGIHGLRLGAYLSDRSVPRVSDRSVPKVSRVSRAGRFWRDVTVIGVQDESGADAPGRRAISRISGVSKRAGAVTLIGRHARCTTLLR